MLSDAVTNILAVKTYGREDFERGLFDAADQEALAAERISMGAMMRRGAMTSALITLIMFVTSIFVVGGNAWYGISAGTLVMMFTYTYNLSMRSSSSTDCQLAWRRWWASEASSFREASASVW